jgi:predicted PurR-regulated permease PerM
MWFDARAARYAWTVAVIVLLLVLVYRVRTTLLVFILAILFAYLVSPLVNFLDRILPTSRTRTPALALAYVLFMAFLVIGGMQIGSRVIEQANLFIKAFPDLLAKWQQPSPDATPTTNSLKAEILRRIRESVSGYSHDVFSALPKAGLKVLSVAGDLIFVIVVPILSFFFLKDGRLMRNHVLSLVSDGHRRELLEEVMADTHVLLAQYMRALMILCTAVFLADVIFFTIAGVPFALLLATLAALLEFIPMIGPLTAAVIITIIAAINGAPVVIVLIFLGLYRLFQDYVLAPQLMSKGVELHPLMVLFGVFAGAELAGVAGAFLSVPTLAFVRIFYFRMRRDRVRSELTPVVPSV